MQLVFGYPGVGIKGILAAFERADGIPRFVQPRHEEMAAFPPCAYAKFSGRLGVCTATSRPEAGEHMRAVGTNKASASRYKAEGAEASELGSQQAVPLTGAERLIGRPETPGARCTRRGAPSRDRGTGAARQRAGAPRRALLRVRGWAPQPDPPGAPSLGREGLEPRAAPRRASPSRSSPPLHHLPAPRRGEWPRVLPRPVLRFGADAFVALFGDVAPVTAPQATPWGSRWHASTCGAARWSTSP